MLLYVQRTILICHHTAPGTPPIHHRQGISVQCQVPYFVTTKLAKIRHSSLTVPTPQGYAKAAVKCIGYGGVYMMIVMTML